jgi:hypothetical protein
MSEHPRVPQATWSQIPHVHENLQHCDHSTNGNKNTENY